MNEKLNLSWKSTCKILLGEEIGDLQDYEGYLMRYPKLPVVKRSVVSGKDVFLPEGRYIGVRRAVSYDEIKELKQPFDINEIKDIDSLFEKAREMFTFIGNTKLGNSVNVEQSTNIINSSNIYKANAIVDSENIAYASYIHSSKYLFGVHAIADTLFSISLTASGGGGGKTQRAFESFYLVNSSDIYFSHNLIACSDVFFSFFQRGKHYMIGNKQLDKTTYLKLKQHLLEQIRDDLKAGRLKTFIDLIEEADTYYKNKEIPLKEKPQELLSKEYSKTTKLLFGKQHDLSKENTRNFLTRGLPHYKLRALEINGQIDYFVSPAYYLSTDNQKLNSHIIPQQLMQEIEKLSVDVSETDDFDSIFEKVKKQGMVAINFSMGVNTEDAVESPVAFHSSHLYRTNESILNKISAYSFWPRESTHIFGSFCVFKSKYSIRSYRSNLLTRVFEADISNNVSDSFYVHSCESSNNLIFCWGLKGAKYQILNNPVDKNTYLKIKKELVEWINQKVENRKLIPRIFEL